MYWFYGYKLCWSGWTIANLSDKNHKVLGYTKVQYAIQKYRKINIFFWRDLKTIFKEENFWSVLGVEDNLNKKNGHMEY